MTNSDVRSIGLLGTLKLEISQRYDKRQIYKNITNYYKGSTFKFILVVIFIIFALHFTVTLSNSNELIQIELD